MPAAERERTERAVVVLEPQPAQIEQRLARSLAQSVLDRLGDHRAARRRVLFQPRRVLCFERPCHLLVVTQPNVLELGVDWATLACSAVLAVRRSSRERFRAVSSCPRRASSRASS